MGQNLSQHLHLHCVVTGGALAADGTRWIAAPPGFLFPVRALAAVFRGKFLAALRRAFAKGALRFAGSLAPLADPAAFTTWLEHLRHPGWVVYAKRPFAGPAQVLEYLGRYTHRVALSNNRLLSFDDATVQHQLGHQHISTTMRYFHLSQERITGTHSPLDLPKPPGIA